MNSIDVLGAIGEILSWIGFGIGVPLLIIVAVGKAHDGPWQSVDVIIARKAGLATARWYAADRFWERPLRAEETHLWRGREEAAAFVSARHPELMRSEPRRPLLHAVQVLGITLTSAGIGALVLSFLPLFIN